jgi:ubiquinone/menaquinone biosynthesis C-methylase UbiE
MDTFTAESKPSKKNRVCPWWMAYFFDNPLRRMVHPAEKVLGPYVARGMSVLDVGCGFGHYTLGMARLAGTSGQVVAADVQQRMLDKTMARARKAGLEKTVRPLLCDGRHICAQLTFDFILACNVLHEAPEPAVLLSDLFAKLKSGGKLLLMEPTAHLKEKDFQAEVALAKKNGFKEVDRPQLIRQMCALLQNPITQAIQ